MKISLLRRLHADDAGATAIEYGLIAALLVVAILVTLGSVANQTNIMWTNVGTRVGAATAG